MCAREVGKATTQSASFHSFDCLLVHKPPNEKWPHNRGARESMVCEFYIQPEYIVGNAVYFPFLGVHCVRDTIPRNRNKPRLLFPAAWFKHKTTRAQYAAAWSTMQCFNEIHFSFRKLLKTTIFSTLITFLFWSSFLTLTILSLYVLVLEVALLVFFARNLWQLLFNPLTALLQCL